ncbi:MAG: hypothetical protein ABL959_21880 [Pyrinomonadaceae bacterium]
MSKPAEILVFEFLTEICAASEPGSTLYELELHDTIWRSITKATGVRVSDADADFAPGQGGGLKEVDTKVILVPFARVEGPDTKERQAAVQKVFEIQEALIAAIYADQYLGERVCDTLIGRSPRSFENLDGKPYAIANIPLVINPVSGQDADSYYK